jgi:hypothetical protein
MTDDAMHDIAAALWATREQDRNVTDALFAIAAAISEVARHIEGAGFPPLAGQTFDVIEAQLGEIADAILCAGQDIAKGKSDG